MRSCIQDVRLKDIKQLKIYYAGIHALK